MQKKKSIIFDIVIIAISLFYVLGTALIFTSCPPKDDGSFMTCHWAWKAVVSCAVVLLIQSVIRLLFHNHTAKAAISAAMIPIAVLSAIIPNNIIKLCMMTDMHCHTALKPFALVMGIIISLVLAANTAVEIISAKE